MTCFEATIQSGELRTILDAVTVLVKEGRVILNNDGVLIRGTDPAGVGVVQAKVSKDVFEDPEIGQRSLCLNFIELTDMIKTADADTDVQIQVDENEMEINILDLEFSLSLIDPGALDKDQPIPDLDLPAKLVIESPAFRRGIRAGNLVADHIEFAISETDPAFYMQATGDTNEVVMEKKKEDLGLLTADSVSSTFSLEYLIDICGAIPSDPNIRVHLGDDHPTEISFNILEEGATVTYFLAPRLEPDS